MAIVDPACRGSLFLFHQSQAKRVELPWKYHLDGSAVGETYLESPMFLMERRAFLVVTDSLSQRNVEHHHQAEPDGKEHGAKVGMFALR